jgi:hypothetical protein
MHRRDRQKSVTSSSHEIYLRGEISAQSKAQYGSIPDNKKPAKPYAVRVFNVRGGGTSQVLTRLSDNFPITGKNTAIFAASCLLIECMGC